MLFELKDISKKIHKDYDGCILEETKNEEVKRLFNKVSTKLKETNKGNTPLVNIVYNHFNGTLPDVNYVSGPNTLTFQTSDDYGMKIYIFGETHGKEKSCETLDYAKSSNTDISTYLQQVFLNSDKFIDFYLEDELFRDVQTDRSENFLHMIRNDFYNCLNPKKRSECMFKTIRAHFIDSRQEYEDSLAFPTTNIGKLISHLENPDDFFSDKIRVSRFKTITDKLASFDSYAKLAEYMIEVAYNVPIIEKEFNRCILDKKALIYGLRDVLADLYPQHFTIEYLKTLDITKTPVSILIKILTVLEAVVSDLYTITRMFKTFKKTNYFPQKQKYIIYYGGDYHSIVIRRFLEKIKFQEVIKRKSDIKTSMRCLDMSGIKLDFK